MRLAVVDMALRGNVLLARSPLTRRSSIAEKSPTSTDRVEGGFAMMRSVMTLLVVLTLQAIAGAVDITTCGQLVPAGEVGVLQADLSGCVANDVAVAVADRGMLQLNGHAIESGAVGVQCVGRRCTVEGPGEVRDLSLFGIWITAERGRLVVRDAVVRDNGSIGIASTGSLARIALERVTVTGSRSGIETTTNGGVTGEDVDASGNLQWGVVSGKKLRLTRSTVLDTGVGQPEPGDGVVSFAGKATLIDSTVTGSTGKDLLTFKPPRLVRSICGSSGSPYIPSLSWGVCTDD
jgi:hypothetical protein